jgi:UDP-N-acetylmuramoylalanine--D-glutamate ligase
MAYDFTNKRVAVIGMARSGLAAAEVLAERDAKVTLYDSKPAEELGEALDRAKKAGIAAVAAANSVGEADLVVTSPGVRKSAPILQDALSRNIPIWGEIEAAYRIASAPILAITGTNGKTTTTILVGEMMKAAGYETYIAGNIAAGEIALPLIKAAHVASESAVIVAEISSFQLEWIDQFRPRVAALLNITSDHLDRQSWDEYVAAKWRIFENLTKDDAAVLGETVFRGEEYRDQVQELKRRTQIWAFGSDNSDDQLSSWFTNTYVCVDSSHAGVNVGIDLVCRLSEVKLPGQHNLENICAAAAMATAFGIEVEPIREVATAFTGVVHRLEYVATISGVRYINNSMCTNNAAYARSLEAVPEPKIVLTGGVYKGGDIAPLADAVAKNNVRTLVLFGKSSREIEDAGRRQGYESIRLVETLADAVEVASREAKPGDAVILNPGCASFDQFRDFEDRGDKFKELVNKLAERKLASH